MPGCQEKKGSRQRRGKLPSITAVQSLYEALVRRRVSDTCHVRCVSDTCHVRCISDTCPLHVRCISDAYHMHILVFRAPLQCVAVHRALLCVGLLCRCVCRMYGRCMLDVYQMHILCVAVLGVSAYRVLLLCRVSCVSVCVAVSVVCVAVCVVCRSVYRVSQWLCSV